MLPNPLMPVHPGVRLLAVLVEAQRQPMSQTASVALLLLRLRALRDRAQDRRLRTQQRLGAMLLISSCEDSQVTTS